jgi:hypothetical protein
VSWCHPSCCSTVALFLVGAAAHAGALAQQTAKLPDVPAPPQGEAQWIAQSMRMNGLPMTLKAYRCRLAPDDVLEYYESAASHWGRNEFHRFSQGAARVLAIRSARYYITIEVKGTVGGSEGTITVSDSIQPRAPQIESQFPHPRTARLLSRQEYEDAGIESEHLSLASARSAAIEAQAFVQELTRDGWQVLRHEPMQTSTRGMVIEAQRGAQLAQLTLQPDQSLLSTTAIVIVWRKS